MLMNDKYYINQLLTRDKDNPQSHIDIALQWRNDLFQSMHDINRYNQVPVENFNAAKQLFKINIIGSLIKLCNGGAISLGEFLECTTEIINNNFIAN